MQEDKWFDNDENVSISEIVKLANQYRTDSLVVAIEEILLEKDATGEELNKSEIVVLAVEAMEREVNNGGFHQFFLNSSCRFAPCLSQSLSLIGVNKTKGIVDKAIGSLGIEDLSAFSDVEDYYKSLQEAMEKEDIIDKLNALDNEYYAVREDIASLLLKHIIKNINQFK